MKKYLLSTFGLINNINKKRQLKIQVGRTKNHAYNNRKFVVSKSNGKYIFKTSTKIRKGVQDNKELNIKRDTEIQLSNNRITYYTKGKHLLLSEISYPDVNQYPLEKSIQGSISTLSTKRSSFYNQDRCYRMVVPLNKTVSLFGDFTGRNYSVDGKRKISTLVKLHISNIEYHFYCVKHSGGSFFVIDGINRQSLLAFQTVANSILLAYAFLKGDYHGREVYILTYSSVNLDKPNSILTNVLGNEMYNGFATHSTKPHSLVIIQSNLRYKKDKNGKIIGVKDDHLKKYMVEFPSECLSNLCQLIVQHGGILRALILFVNNHSSSLEVKIPGLFVAIENISKVLVGGNISPPLLIEDKEVASKIKTIIKKTVKEISKMEKEVKDPLSEDEAQGYTVAFERIRQKLYNFNRGTNNKKLVGVFAKFGYNLTDEEVELLIRHRNKFLHGDDFISLDDSYELEFRELFHISMRLHKLVAVLLLKASGFSGYILNNAKIYDYISEKELKETVFVKI